MSKVTIYSQGRLKTIGSFNNGILTKKGKSVQLFRMFDGFALPAEVLHKPEIDSIVIHYDGDIYQVRRETWQEKGIEHKDPKFEPQLVLPRQYFQMVKSNQTTLFN